MSGIEAKNIEFGYADTPLFEGLNVAVESGELVGLAGPNGSGKTIIAVSHDLNLASQYCRRVLVFGRGELMFDGPPDEAITMETVRDVYGAEVVVRTDSQTGRPFVLPIRPLSPRTGQAISGDRAE